MKSSFGAPAAAVGLAGPRVFGQCTLQQEQVVQLRGTAVSALNLVVVTWPALHVTRACGHTKMLSDYAPGTNRQVRSYPAGAVVQLHPRRTSVSNFDRVLGRDCCRCLQSGSKLRASQPSLVYGYGGGAPSSNVQTVLHHAALS
jgi:hypothetical protein